ncbi:uncharacterized protein LOC123555866 [Mercenaria mercenaria]|uniref:uncharacterized protein LOC123555866 n=1 Tax=Mercenaria mercenaria TaxID=6596 RepID=UPI00234EA60B|nr:uncharacterized protein LOC123555866 [Mercenaria mercenaria]
MSCAVDTAWHKCGFDRLTSHTFFMSKAKYGKKVVKTVVSHRTCGTCNWWRRNRPGQTVRQHKCVRNHQGSARLMESVSGVKGIQELAQEGTPVEYIEGDGDNTMLARLKNELNVTLKKRYDRNHVKNVGKSLYALHHEKGVKLSKSVIIHIEKCSKYALAKNQGDRDALEDNLKALTPHQFGDHSLCKGQFCGYKRKRGEFYVHRNLPYKTSLNDADMLRQIFDPLIAKVDQYVDLGSSQQCEHANREVTLRAPKHLHYGSSKSLDYRVHATAAFINEGGNYISKVY